MKASKAEGGEQSSSRLLEQLGLYPSATSEELSNTLEQKEKPRSEENQRQEKEEEESGDVFLPVERPIQKNKKRCWTCKTKLELAQRELGGCKCGESHSKYKVCTVGHAVACKFPLSSLYFLTASVVIVI